MATVCTLKKQSLVESFKEFQKVVLEDRLKTKLVQLI